MFGPYDIADVPDDGISRLDLGSLQVPQFPDTKIQLQGDNGEVTADGEPITGVMVVDGQSGVHIVACAAPRSGGLWEEVREALRESLSTEDTPVLEGTGDLGPEIHAVVPTPQGPQPVRFVGVDGPRWMLRAVFSGKAAADVDAGTRLMQVVRATVVVRGDNALPVRDPLPLQLAATVTAKVSQ